MQEEKNSLHNPKNKNYLSVYVPIPVNHSYWYLSNSFEPVAVGTIVKIPLGNRLVWGIVCKTSNKIDFGIKKIKMIEDVYSEVLFSKSFLGFIEFMSHYTMTPIGTIVKMLLQNIPSNPENFLIEGYQKIESFTDDSKCLNSSRIKVLDVLESGAILRQADLLQKALVSKSVLSSLEKLGAIKKVHIPFVEILSIDSIQTSKTLNAAQKEASDRLSQAVLSEERKVFVLEGVTGSGKTEVYFEAINQALRCGKQVLILMPEIMLTQQFLERFSVRFGFFPKQWHSSLRRTQREKIWYFTSVGRIRVVVGARSALFLPFKNLGLIIVDEEHDSSYKQEERVFYHARDMAVLRGYISKFPVILVSATPSVETQVNILEKRYEHVVLPQRVLRAELPSLEAIDLRRDPPVKGFFLSPILVEEIKKTFFRNQQSLLFLNRRGYAPLTLCRSCGFRFECLHCRSWLVYHRAGSHLLCHHCGYKEKMPSECPSCSTSNSLVGCGPGVERIEEEVKLLIPEARVLVLSTDLQGNIKKIRDEIDTIYRRDVDIVIGTQLIAKGHHFPWISLVGVVDADAGLNGHDLRACERSFQLLVQVTGRAGRSGLKSKGLLQTWFPDHSVIQALTSGSEKSFYASEIKAREEGRLPPYGKFAAIIVSSPKSGEAHSYAQSLCRNCRNNDFISVLGPVEAPLSYLRDRYRFRILLHASRKFKIQEYIAAMIKGAKKCPSNVGLEIDIDPQNFL